MKTAAWAGALAIAVLWPARLSGALDGAPLDAPLEAVLIGIVLPALIWFHPRALRTLAVRGAILLLLSWKLATGLIAAPDGWCLTFTSPVPVFLENTLVPHSWDVRADWRAPVPQCSAVMTHAYTELERFPAWFYNLPPASFISAARPSDRPPNVSARLDVNGFLNANASGQLKVTTDEGVALSMTIDDTAVSNPTTDVAIAAGLHRVSMRANLTGSHWRLIPEWNGRDVWSTSVATMTPPRTIDLWLRPWGRFVPGLLVLVIIATALGGLIKGAGSSLIASAALSIATVGAALSGREAAMRFSPVLFFGSVFARVPRRFQNLKGLYLWIGIPFLAIVAARGLAQVGLFTWYSSGDDWWMFQRFAYRIYLQGFWLEGGERTFWFQPLYRWIAGALHMVFGDSSVGELYWDGAWTFVGAVFTFHIVRTIAGFRWGMAAAATTLALMLLGPAWYLFGRGLSEITSAGFLYGAALFALRGRHGYRPALIAAGLLATCAFYSRLNNLPMAIAVAAFAWPVKRPTSDLYRPASLLAGAARPVLASILACVAASLWLFTARTYYFTRVPSMLFGTQAGLLSVWQITASGSIVDNVIGSVMMVLTMNDPWRFDVRAIPILAGACAAIAAVLRIGRLRQLPFNAVCLCLAGLSGAFVARGSAYPGRFSVHLIPVTVALAMSAAAVMLNANMTSRRDQT